VSGRGRVCFYSERAYLVLDPSAGEFSGGAEVLAVLLMRGLVERGYDVSLVTCDFGQPERVTIDGITVHRAFPRYGGIPVLRFFHPRLTRAYRALARADAEVYYVIGAGMPAGVVNDVATVRGAGMLLHAMSDYDVQRHLPRYMWRDRVWYRRAMRRADRLFAQTEFQRQAFRQNFGMESRVLPNLIDIPAQPVDAGQPGYVMWLGTYKAIKRPEWFVELARALPHRRFVMTGVIPPAPLPRDHWEAAAAAAREFANLEVLSFQPVEELERLMRGASLVVHTSPTEGFSNVMLEAWALGVPTVSSVNPDGLVTRLRLGAVATDFPFLVESVENLMSSPAERRAAGERARRYVIEHHAPEPVFATLTEELDRVIARVRRARGR
jgi:glycosyltransferase involved in cell wall biosynthesis